MEKNNFIGKISLNMNDLIKAGAVVNTASQIKKAKIKEAEKEVLEKFLECFPKSNDRLDVFEWKENLGSLKKAEVSFIYDNIDSIISIMTRTKEEKKKMLDSFYPYEIIEDYYGQYTYYFDKGNDKNVVDILTSIYFDMEGSCRKNISSVRFIDRDIDNSLKKIEMFEKMKKENDFVSEIEEFLEQKYNPFCIYPEVRSVLDYSKNKVQSFSNLIIEKEINKIYLAKDNADKGTILTNVLQGAAKTTKVKMGSMI